MKKIILFLFIQIALISQIFATNIEISTDKNAYNLDENIILYIEISSDSSGNISVENISGLENFSQYGSSQRQETSIINGKINTKKIVEFILRANQEGKYNIGPVEVKSDAETIESNGITVIIGEPQIIPEENNNSQTTQQNKQNVSEENNNNSQEKNISETDLMGNFIESKKIEINYKKFSYFGIFGLVFFIIFYYFIIKFLENKTKKQTEKINIEKPKVSQEDFVKTLNDKLNRLSINSQNYSKNDFYKQLNLIFREYFEYLGVNNAYIKTYSDLKGDNIEQKLFTMFEKSYFEEFSSNQDELSQRKQIIMNFMIYLK